MSDTTKKSEPRLRFRFFLYIVHYSLFTMNYELGGSYFTTTFLPFWMNTPFTAFVTF